MERKDVRSLFTSTSHEADHCFLSGVADGGHKKTADFVTMQFYRIRQLQLKYQQMICTDLQ